MGSVTGSSTKGSWLGIIRVSSVRVVGECRGFPGPEAWSSKILVVHPSQNAVMPGDVQKLEKKNPRQIVQKFRFAKCARSSEISILFNNYKQLS